MRRIGSLLLVILGFSLTAPVIAQDDDRDDTAFSDGYNLYDRNREGLDWNEYNYPDSGRQSTDQPLR